MSLHYAGQLPATPLASPPVPASDSTHDAMAAAAAAAAAAAMPSPDAGSAAASWVEGEDTSTVIAVDADPPATASTAAQKIAAPPGHWECPAPGTAGAKMIAAHSAVTGFYAFASSLLVYVTVEATKASLATQDSTSPAASTHRANAILCGIGAGAFLACGVVWSLKFLKASIEQGMIRRHD